MDFIQKNRVLVSHIGFWVGYYLLTVLALIIYEKSVYYYLRTFLLVSTHATLTYANMYFFVPVFFFRRRYLLYVILVIAFAISLVEGGGWISRHIPDYLEVSPRQEKIREASHGIFLLLIIALGAGHRVLRVSQHKEKEVALLKRQQLERAREASALKSENLETELKFLKSQINPHFLFNALNNIYTLAYIEADEAPDLILKLSDMLRYILYDCTSQEVPIDKEINYLQNYVELQRLKTDELDIAINIGEFATQTQIAPMLFIPFIENSFKHSKIEDTQQGWLKLNLWAEANQIHFKLANSKPTKEFTKDKVGGIGLQNVKRRLELLYPHRHQLSIENAAEKFEVNLTIRLD